VTAEGIRWHKDIFNSLYLNILILGVLNQTIEKAGYERAKDSSFTFIREADIKMQLME
jgi:hypothetical protein